MSNETIAVVGLGYVGLPVAVALARKYRTIGVDNRTGRIEALESGHDATGEVDKSALLESSVELTSEPSAIAEATFIVVAVPTPIDEGRRPDLNPLISVSRTVGEHIRKGAVVVYESTVYPGVTEDICGPEIARTSGLTAGVDFKLGYSPERINPGDKKNTFESIIKIVSGQDKETLKRVAAVYESVVVAGVHRAPSIKVAEAAKVIENTQRDLNIALMNELALIFDRVGIRTKDVLDAAGTKWNFLKFTPGLVGGHCIDVDPYYLTAKAEELGYHPQVILAGRRINNGIGAFVAQSTLKMLGNAGGRAPRIGIGGLTFKENVPDLRNSGVPDIVNELREFGANPIVHDPMGDPAEALEAYGIELQPWSAFTDLDVLIYAVSHREYTSRSRDDMLAPIRDGGVVIDVKSVIDPADLPRGISYWSL